MWRPKNELKDALLGGRYRVVRALGAGAVGTVYEAKSGPFDTRYAVKVLHANLASDEAVVARFKREAAAAASLKHANVVDVVDFSQAGEHPPYLVMEMLVGQSLREILKKRKRISAERAAHIGVEVLSALVAAHAAKIVHRDIKPDTIFLTETAAAADRIKVMDFGSAKLLGEADAKPLTVTGVVIGTLSFMPPEQALGRRVDGRADIYALAATLYTAVTGRKVVDAPTPAGLLDAVTHQKPATFAKLGIDIDPAFEAILAKGLEKDPADRHVNAEQMMRAFRVWMSAAPSAARPCSMVTPGPVALDVEAEDDSHRRLRLPHAGTMLGRYHLTEMLGAGGLGEVFRADDTSIGRRVAIKVLRIARDQDEVGISVRAAAKLLVEARSAATIRHPNVVEIFDVHYGFERIAYLVMELVPGQSLRHFIGDPYVPIERKVGWLLDIARALSAAHRHGVVHQDIKPDNVMVRDDGVIKVLDFGIARRVFENDSSLPDCETVERIPGTPVYMAPEQMHGEKGSALTDQFTWGVLAYELLTGGIPWLQHGGVLHVIHEILTRTPEAPSRRRSEVPREVDEVVLKALAKDPKDRFASMDAATAALASAWARAVSRPIDEIVARRRPRRGVVAAAAVAMAILGGVASPNDAQIAPAMASTVAELGPPDFGSNMSANPAATAAYAAGIDAVRNAAGGTARKSFDLAIKLDPSFAAAHLRKVLATSEVTDAERENIRQATLLRDSLGEHDRALLHAVSPWVGVPQDALEVERRLVALTNTHRDADYLYHLCRFRVLAGNYNGAMESCRAARDGDPRLAAAYWLEGQSHLFLDDTPAGRVALDACVRIAPNASSCMNDQYQVESHGGACDIALDYAQRLAAIEPESSRWLEHLGVAGYATGKPISAARATLDRAYDASPPRQSALLRAKGQFKLAVLTGNTEDANVRLVAWERAADATNDEVVHREVFRARVLYDREFGREAGLAERARAFLAARPAWSPSPDEDGAVDGLNALYRSGGTSRREFLTARAAWLAHEHAQPRPAGRLGMDLGRHWLNAFADAVMTAEDARQALAVLPSYLPLPPDRFRDTEDDELIGRTFLVADQTKDAVPFLRRAAESCQAVHYPLQHTWANLELGKALESTDPVRACTAYQVVLDRWATVASSQSAHDAYVRRKALGCR